MTLLLANVPSIVFLITGVYLLMHGHTTGGGFCLLVAMIIVHVADGSEKKDGDV